MTEWKNILSRHVHTCGFIDFTLRSINIKKYLHFIQTSVYLGIYRYSVHENTPDIGH